MILGIIGCNCVSSVIFLSIIYASHIFKTVLKSLLIDYVCRNPIALKFAIYVLCHRARRSPAIVYF